ncbi:hypothetical protein [Phenylobacterium sp.]|jgi:hypothetical protein|uniref:hypothetical protein n=1 Tax=Phenylobacterium sp. TaxID=1871053 RepID=UPI0037CA857D
MRILAKVSSGADRLADLQAAIKQMQASLGKPDVVAAANVDGPGLDLSLQATSGDDLTQAVEQLGPTFETLGGEVRSIAVTADVPDGLRQRLSSLTPAISVLPN